MKRLEAIRNFCIIAHIDHGKSTLADRMLELTRTIDRRDFRDQVLDDMDLERERGITIKAHPVTMAYRTLDGRDLQFNLIDTPGHVDFSYEVSRSLAACEGAVLVVDAAQGVEAQTVANALLALEQGLEIIPVLNKIDLPSADVDRVIGQIEDILAIPAQDCLRVSAKTGAGVPEVLERIADRVPPPSAAGGDSVRALVFDSIYDAYRGVYVYLRLVDGELRKGDSIRLMRSGRTYEVKEVGRFSPKPKPSDRLQAGDVGYLVGNMKNAAEIQIGDTVTVVNRSAASPLPGFQEVHPMVFAGLYPVDTSDYEKLQTSLDKLSLNDSAFSYSPESSAALGLGFRCGFLGLLHMEVIQERLRREFDVDIITTYPGVAYRVHGKDGSVLELDNPIHLPEWTRVDHIEEPMIRASILCRNEHIGDILQLLMDKRGEVTKTESIDGRRVMLTADIPLSEILIDFYDRLKSVSHGYASLDYDLAGYRENDLVKMDILVNGEVVDAFSSIVHREKAVARGRQMCRSLKEVIPRQQFAVPLQAAIGRTVIARETIRAYRKDVTAKCYGGDISRKRKLLERQKEGKKRMKQVGQVGIPQEAFIAVLKNQV
jgi:GTP-binding protein LepA